MLETPLVGRFHGEGRRLIFAAPLPYQVLVKGTGALGGAMFLAPLAARIVGFDLPLYEAWWTAVGLSLVVAAVGAAFSLQTIVFDLKERTYRRRQGPGFFPRFSRGRLDDLDAVVVLTEENGGAIPPSVTHHVVLYWKANREPLMVLQKDTRPWSRGQPLNAYAGPILQLAGQYAQALGVTFFDNSYFPSKCPVPFWN